MWEYVTGGKGSLSSCSVEDAAGGCLSDSMCGMPVYVDYCMVRDLREIEAQEEQFFYFKHAEES